MATKQPNQKSQSQIAQQNPAQQPAKDQKPAQQPAKDGKSSTAIPAANAKENGNKDANQENKSQNQNQNSKTNLQPQQNDPNQRKGSNIALPNNLQQQSQQEKNNKNSISKDLVSNDNQQPGQQKSNNSVTAAKHQGANSDLMGNFFDSFNQIQQPVHLEQQNQETNNQQQEEKDDLDFKDQEDDNLKPIPTDDPKELERRKNQAEMFKKYLDNTGISMAFQIIYAEILSKKINAENVFGYTAMRLRQIGNDLAAIQHKVKK
ncbi:hypothetical protein TTHERM_00016520 (macronuclear) [Tetrahymena thermophila SB210]|uniref:Uncharacterized protein n=1 Tax=Tetrahymena thermophila (strain SB210) TaxID=312017 RepID=Q22RD6_TETTS|nr:hypothetical protein TTHERM_00016520 [Tetrahymena thermophila SB210]EAR88186.2 hypothetical protein TTHERM_00016520 [Tetrahymena thermophila SB210]|eukprot:XP_001008431.2 hypothetical protein TTHERM_00016520 [Tetrahymena thermophila SB210]